MFLMELFEDNLGYSAINTARSAISNVVILSDAEHVTVGDHPLIKRFLRGVFNEKPSLPRYKSVWDVSQVLDWLKGLDIDTIALKLLTIKTTMLLALLSGQRVQTLQALSINNVEFTDTSAVFRLDVLLKQSKPGRHLSSINFKGYHDRQLCVITHLKKYIEVTKGLRKSDMLLISYQKPHSPVTTDTIARWLKMALRNSGIDTEVFAAHSTRSASSSAAAAHGCTINDIMNHVGWSNAKTFATYYNKECVKTEQTFSDKVLQSNTT
jgi:hypothetical protein